MARVYVGLGSNEGDRRRNIDEAAKRLGGTREVRVVRVSRYYETKPVGGPPQDDYLNGAAELETTLEPGALLELCLKTEEEMGRKRTVRWGPRVIDIDVLLFDERVIETPGLTVPHPLMHRRQFVLEPLVEIAPEAVHPTTGKTVRELLEELERKNDKWATETQRAQRKRLET